ncbi:MAG: hypothetical protein GY787_15035 [Alteromonadales bacterium]|nr:hypothetical protein [Alteromonadales bacterium]
MSKLRDMLFTSAHADKAKALLTLELLEENPAGIGDHSTEDFYKNAEEALAMLADADERLETIEKYLDKKQVI